MESDLAVFEGHEIRRCYDEKTETWWFAVVDVIQVLTQQPDFQTARKYWNKLKERLNHEGSQGWAAVPLDGTRMGGKQAVGLRHGGSGNETPQPDGPPLTEFLDLHAVRDILSVAQSKRSADQ